MKLPQGKIKFASVFLFLILAVNFMAAQKPLTNPDGDLVPNGKHGNSGQTQAPVHRARLARLWSPATASTITAARC